jgi:hypothetical protein
MSFSCTRCNKNFDSKSKLSKHYIKIKENPCDFICHDCGEQLYSYITFIRHQNTCTAKKNTLENLTQAPEIVHKTYNTNKYSNTNSNNNYNNTINNTINIDMRGMVIKHTEEMKIDKEQLLGDIVEKILFRMDTGLSGKANWGTMAFTDSFHQMFAHIYANKDKPGQQNLLLKDETTRELQVFNGESFVDDKLTSEERMLKVLNFIGDGLRWMVDNCDNYSEEEKEAKSDKIGRVLSGIPRFKMTYKAMFDNIYKSLKEVKDEIEERSTARMTITQ